MENLLEQTFGLSKVVLKKLTGYDNVNYLLTCDSGRFILKTYPYDKELLALVEAENNALHFLAQNNPNQFPEPIKELRIIIWENEKLIVRLLTFLPGEFLGQVEQNHELLGSLGQFLAKLDNILLTFDHPIPKTRRWEWDLQYLSLNKKYLSDISLATERNLVRYFMLQFEENVVPQIPNLRMAYIHNDANESNILVTHNRVTGLIDFGDLAYSMLINELAIALTYVCYDKENPLEWAEPVLSAYHKELELLEIEVKLLYYLIAARLCTSVCNSAHTKKHNPHNLHALSSEKMAWIMLKKWLALGPIAVENSFRSALGWKPLAQQQVDSALQRRYQSISPLLSVSYDDPILMEGAAFQYMYDQQGTSFLDAYNNIPHVGHSHPKVVEAGQRQLAKLNTNTRYLYNQLADYAEKLLAKFPPSLSKVYFVNSGSAASDLAIRLAFAYSKNQALMVMDHGYHGHTRAAIDISAYKFNHKKGQGQQDYILKVPLPDTYRGKYKTPNEQAGKLYAQEAIEQLKYSGKTVAAFISEPIVGCGGQVPLALGYLQELYPAIRNQGGVCISDEVQTGFGRLGEHFWGYEAHNVVPDIVILGKPIANGHPMGAVVCTEEIAACFAEGPEFFSSFGGNPVSCAIAQAVLEVLEEEKLPEHAQIVGAYFQKQLNELQKQYPAIGDVRGAGLFIGIELIIPGTLDPNPKLANYLKNELRKRHILISTDGPFDSVLKSKPPLCFTTENVDQVVRELELLLKNYPT